ncbi:uncharacterized protein K444DRAFT_302853 [Hyaloscypha bicolor E]|uniref:Uncharacterized protein n=1 Tax=Hyaloscypha bicolor E TaxID=1095630 RepID=A0A2J6TN98_9HELO|nr:uncharacterized protein K444DRAFT_302853 [Hyaloscypha bicolor E]PMD64504.1 hypothetical protein K444DRAFT_302853 [Hyaloscypha bicolor E]
MTSFNSHGAFVANSSWDARNAIVRGWKDDGDCLATFGQQCEDDWIRAISQARASAPNHNASISVCGDMIIPSIPPSCQGLFMVATISHNFVQANETEGNALFDFEDSPHVPANTTYYETAAAWIWPILLLQFPADSGSYSTQMSCLRATKPPLDRWPS